jgi:general stress protein YciG
MNRDKQREIASKGGRAAHAKGTAHEWTAAEAQAAGRKGGLASQGGKTKERREAEARTKTDQRDRKDGLLEDAEDHEVARFADEGNPHG